MKTKILTAVLVMFVMCGCGKKQTNEWEPKGLGKYVYVDKYNVVHSSRHCISFHISFDDDGSNDQERDSGVVYVPTSWLPHWRHETVRMCPHCVNDHQADQIYEFCLGYTEHDDDIYDGRN